MEKKKIMVVEDEKPIRELMADLFLSRDIGVDSYPDGAAVLETINADNPPDLVITDFRMPRIDGAELSTVIRDTWPEMTIIMISATPSEIPENHKADVILIKPFRIKILTGIVSGLLS